MNSHDYWIFHGVGYGRAAREDDTGLGLLVRLRGCGSPSSHVGPVEGLILATIVRGAVPVVRPATDDPRGQPRRAGRRRRPGTRRAAEVRWFADALNDKYGTGYPLAFFEDNALVPAAARSAFGVADGRFTGSPTRWWFDDDGNHAGHG